MAEKFYNKQIHIRAETDELLTSLKVGDESYNSVIFRKLKESEGVE